MNASFNRCLTRSLKTPVMIISLVILSSLVFGIQTQVFAADNPYLKCPDCNDTSNIQQIPPLGITVTTNKPSYNDGDTLTISGSVQDYISDTPVTIRIMSPTGLVVKIDQVDVNADRTYSESILPSNINWQGAGTYHVMVQYGSPDRSTQTTFQFVGTSTTQTGNATTLSPIPAPSQPMASKIPHWVKTVFSLYGQGQISDDDLISALRFLIQTGVIKVS